jgi:hypothetical protein
MVEGSFLFFGKDREKDENYIIRKNNSIFPYHMSNKIIAPKGTPE